MQSIYKIAWLILIAVLAPCCVGQEGKQEAADRSLGGGQELTSGGSSDEGIFGETLGGKWNLGGYIQGLQTFDDNVFLRDSFQKSDTTSRFSADLSAAKRTRRAQFEFRYMPEYDMHQRYSAFDAFSQGYLQSVTYELTKFTEIRWQLGARNIPSRNNLPFATLSPLGFAFSAYDPQALESGVDILAGDTSLAVTHRFSRHSRVNATVRSAATSFSKLGSQSLTAVSRLTYSGGFLVDWEHDVSPRSSVGMQTSSTYFGFVSPGHHQYFHSFEGTFRRDLGRGFKLNVGAGPSFSQSQAFLNGPLEGSRVSYAVDARLDRRSRSTGIYLQFSRGTQLGLLQDSLTSYSAVLGVRHSFGRKWAVSVSSGYSRSDSVIALGSTEGMVNTAELRYRISGTLSAVSSYSFARQHGQSNDFLSRNFNRNQFAVGFRYTPRFSTRESKPF